MRATTGKRIFLFIVAMTAFALPAFAVGSGGYENATFGAKALALGNAFVAESDDPSAVSFNPAGLTEVPGIQVQTGLALINPYLEYHGSGSGAGQEEHGNKAIIWTPNTYVTYQLPFFNKRFSFGFGMTAPFGLITEYSSTGPFSRLGFYNSLKVAGYSIEGAARITDWFSIGAGAICYDSKLEQNAKLNMDAFGGPNDALAKLNEKGTAWGWNLGVKIKPHPKHTLGVFYRSSARATLKGQIRVEEIPAGAQIPIPFGGFGGPYYEDTVRTDFTYPPNITVGYLFKPTPKWNLEADLGVTGWSRYKRAEFTLGRSQAVLNALTPQAKNWTDSLSVHFGTSYKLSKRWTPRAGFIFYSTPQTERNWAPDVADSNRYAPTVGLSFATKHLVVDFAYLAIFYQTRNVDSEAGSVSGASVDGRYKSFANEFMLSSTFRF